MTHFEVRPQTDASTQYSDLPQAQANALDLAYSAVRWLTIWPMSCFASADGTLLAYPECRHLRTRRSIYAFQGKAEP
jgi:hypothetical protein